MADSSGVLRQLATDGHARILVYGSPDAWECDIAQDQHQRDRLGLPLSFVAFVKGDATVKFFLAEFREP